MAQKSESVGVKAAKINKSAVITAAVITAILASATAFVISFVKNQEKPPLLIAVASTPQAPPAPLPSVAATPLPVLAKMPARQKPIQIVNRTKAPDLPDKQSQNSNLSPAQPQNEKEKILDGYIEKYIEKYGSVDLTDAPCGAEEIKTKRNAETLLGLIDDLAAELRRKNITDGFVRDRRGFSYKFSNCK